jgi:hypothetical protein
MSISSKAAESVTPIIVIRYSVTSSGVPSSSQQQVTCSRTAVEKKEILKCNRSDFNLPLRARGSVVVKALCYKPEGRGFDTR